MNARPLGIKILALAAAYFAAAALSRLLAIPPGYATVVWPPAGAALAALWLWGGDLWPGVLLGSFAANLWSPAGAPVGSPVSIAAWISVGAAAQAWAGWALARRALSGRDPLGGERDLFSFLAVGGPLTCLISSSWSLLGMRMLHIIALREAAYSWTTWWVGDCVGVALAAPLILLWFGREGSTGRRGRGAVTGALVVTLATIAVIHLYAVGNEERVLRDHARRKLADMSLTLRVGLAGHLDSLQTSADIFASENVLTREEFHDFALGILARHPGMQALEWRPRVLDADRAAVEARARRDGLKDFSFQAFDPRRKSVRQARAPVYFPILYAEPLKGNEAALGLDLGQPQVRAAAEEALATGRPRASSAIRLVQETGDQKSVVVLTPVRSSRHGGPVGLIEGVYRVGDMMESLLAGVDEDALGLRLYDDTPPHRPELLYSRGVSSGTRENAVTVTGDFAGRRWSVELIPNASFQARTRTALSWFVLAADLLLAYLAAWIVLTLFARAERVSALVEAKTAELRAQERQLMRSQKLESVGRLAGGIAHEFNNILMGAAGLTQIVQQNLGPSHPNSPDLDGVLASIKRAGHLVTQLLTYSRRKEARRTPLDLNELIMHLSKMIGAAVGRRVELQVEVGSEPAWIMADASQVEQVLLNLCFNARDAVSGKGRIRLAARPEAVNAPLDGAVLPVTPGRYVVLEVADDGPGIPAEVQSRLFEPFFTTKPFGEGSGLGMSVVSGIVRQHGGGLDIRTSPGKGTAIRVYWPAADAPPPEKTPVRDASAPRGEGSILVVDDEPQMRTVLEKLLTGFGYRVVCAAGGEEAVKLLAGRPETRGVVLDLVMPGMDGLETYDRLTALRPGLKVLFLSGYAPRASENEVSRRGLPFLAKPADAGQLAWALHELLTGEPRA